MSTLEQDAIDAWTASFNAREAAREGDNYGIALNECVTLGQFKRHPNPHIRNIASDPEGLYRSIQPGPEAA